MVEPAVSWTMRHKGVQKGVQKGAHKGALLGALLIGALASGAHAEPVTATGSLSSRHTDNVGKTNVKESGTESTARIGIRHVSDPGQCQSDLTASLGYTYWLNDFYDPESSAESGFDGNCEIRPGLNWRLRNNLSQVLASSRQNDTPENRSRRNIFSTGPILTVPVTSVDQISASVNFENTEYEDPQVRDSDRYTGSLGWNHLFDATLSGGVSASVSQQELDNGAETDSNSVNINLNKTWAATQLNASVGFTRRKNQFGSAEQTSDGFVGSLSLTREINPSSSFFLSASRQITDQASDFTLQFGDVNFDFTEEAGVEVTALELGLQKSFSDGTALDVRSYANQSDYLETDERENTVGLRLGLNRPIRPQLSFQSSVSYEYLRFESNLRDDQRALASVGLSYSLTSDLDCSASIGHSMRKSDLRSSEFDENWAQISLSYRFL